MSVPLFTHSGTVIHGEKIGRQIGFPTINIDSLPPAEFAKGVYVGICTIDDKTFDCLIYFGPRLIFGEHKDCFEAYIYNFNEEIYGKKVDFDVLEFARTPLPFTTLLDLQTQLEKDKTAGAQALQKLHATI